MWNSASATLWIILETVKMWIPCSPAHDSWTLPVAKKLSVTKSWSEGGRQNSAWIKSVMNRIPSRVKPYRFINCLSLRVSRGCARSKNTLRLRRALRASIYLDYVGCHVGLQSNDFWGLNCVWFLEMHLNAIMPDHPFPWLIDGRSHPINVNSIKLNT